MGATVSADIAVNTVTATWDVAPRLVSSQEAYVKASNADAEDFFGARMALSGDGNTLAIGANGEDSAATDVNGDETDNNSENSGAVYVYTRDGDVWSQQAYLKASNAEANDSFGRNATLSDDGKVLATTAAWEDGGATGVNGDQSDNTAPNAGAVYVFR